MRNYFVIIVALLFSCNSTDQGKEVLSAPEEATNPAIAIVNEAIEVSGGDNYLNSRISFDFRDRSYVGTRNGGLFTYERIFEDSLGSYRDILDNDSFTRELNGQAIDVIDTMAQKYTNSVNSVLYFALLPYGLNDGAVNKKYLGEASVNDTQYDKIEITFQQEGGGVDYQDVFVYWINKETRFVDYFGYTYETDGGGVRFREAYNARVISGIRFQDYVNYKPADGDSTELAEYDRLLQEDKLVELSRIELKNIEVEIN